MAFVNLSGILTNSIGGIDVGATLKMTHLSTTGDTLGSTITKIIIPPNGAYDIDLNFGIVRFDYTTEFTQVFLATTTINGDTTATTITELLNSVVEPTSPQLLLFQDILADAQTAETNAAASAVAAAASEANAAITRINDLTQPYIFATVADFKSSLLVFPDGKTIHLSDRDADFTKITGTGTANTFGIIASTSVNQSVSLPTNEPVDVINFGAITGIIDDSAPAIQAGVAHCILNTVSLAAEGIFRLNSLVDFRGCRVKFSLADLRIYHAGIGVIVGGFSNDPANKSQDFGLVIRIVGSDTYSTPSVRCIGARGQRISMEFNTYFQCYANTDSSVTLSENIAYSDFDLQHCDTLELTNNAATDGTIVQWINENTFKIRAITNLLVNGTYHHNNNTFTGGNFEGTALIDMQKGRTNYVRDIRSEHNTGQLTINFAIGVNDCIVIKSWVSSGHLYHSDVQEIVNNNGEMCALQHEFDTLAPLIPILGIHYQTLKKVGLDYNVLFVKDVSIGVADLSAPIGTEIYRSQLIPVTAGNGFFEVDAIGVVIGGIRVQVKGFDTNRAVITPAANQVTYAGSPSRQFDEDDVGINNSISSSFFVIDGSCRYIEISISIAGAGISCQGFYVGARYADIQQRKAAVAHTHVINNFV